MKFGPVNVAEAQGCILAHSIAISDGVLKKGLVLDADAIEKLSASGLKEVIVARLEPGDCHENDAAERITKAFSAIGCRIEKPFTGRCNLLANQSGILQLDAETIHALNRLDPALSIATLRPFDTVRAGQIVITVKIIPFSLPDDVVQRAEELLAAQPPEKRLEVSPFVAKKFGLVATVLGKTSEKMLNKTRKVLEERLENCGSTLAEEVRVAHDVKSVVAGLNEMSGKYDGIILFGASAIVDSEDIIPSAIRAAGGEVTYFGMPVDPGNLLLIGNLNGQPVIGAPGCARSPKENGFDWVLQRTLAKISVGPEDIQAMGVGGLLKEISSRPQPRRQALRKPQKSTPKIAAIILAAGQSRRMGKPNKLLTTLKGVSFIRHVADIAVAADLAKVIVVTGHEANKMHSQLTDLSVDFAHNEYFADGLSSSLRCGINALDDDIDAALVLLSDMPFITADTVRTVAQTFSHAYEERIIVPHFQGRRGNPVLWPRRYFRELMEISGDQGARALLKAYPDAVHEIELGEEVLIDIDTPESAASIGADLNMGGGDGDPR